MALRPAPTARPITSPWCPAVQLVARSVLRARTDRSSSSRARSARANAASGKSASASPRQSANAVLKSLAVDQSLEACGNRGGRRRPRSRNRHHSSGATVAGSTLRSSDTYFCSVLLAVTGGRPSQTSSIRRSADTNTTGVEQQSRQHRALAQSSEPDLLTVVEHLQRPEDAELHHSPSAPRLRVPPTGSVGRVSPLRHSTGAVASHSHYRWRRERRPSTKSTSLVRVLTPPRRRSGCVGAGAAGDSGRRTREARTIQGRDATASRAASGVVCSPSRRRG